MHMLLFLCLFWSYGQPIVKYYFVPYVNIEKTNPGKLDATTKEKSGPRYSYEVTSYSNVRYSFKIDDRHTWDAGELSGNGVFILKTCNLGLYRGLYYCEKYDQ